MEQPSQSQAARKAIEEIRRQSQSQQDSIDAEYRAQSEAFQRLRQACRDGGEVMEAAVSAAGQSGRASGAPGSTSAEREGKHSAPAPEASRKAPPEAGHRSCPPPAPERPPCLEKDSESEASREDGPKGSVPPPPPLPPRKEASPGPDSKGDVTREEVQAALASAGALLGSIVSEKAENEKEKRKKKKRGRLRRRLKWIFWLVILAAALGLGLYYWPRVQAVFSPKTSITPISAVELKSEEVMGCSEVDFTNAVLGEARERGMLVVLEKDVQVDSQISQSLASFSLFQKTKTVHSFGTGVYGVDLSLLDQDSVTVDMTKQTVTVTIPPAQLEYVYVDVDKTTFEETERAIFAFGDIKLTPEQQSMLEQSIDSAMHEALETPSLYELADKNARTKLTELFQPVIGAVSPAFLVQVVTKGQGS